VYDADDEDAPDSEIHIYPTSLTYQHPDSAFALLNACHASTAATAAAVPAKAILASGVSTPITADGPCVGVAPQLSAGPTAPLQELPLSNARNYFMALKARLHPQAQAQAVTSAPDSAAPVGFSSYNASMTIQQRQRVARLPRVPAAAPPAQLVIPPYKAARLAAILAASDSEDERPLFPKYRRGEDFGEHRYTVCT
jgi:hypothetical protein